MEAALLVAFGRPLLAGAAEVIDDDRLEETGHGASLAAGRLLEARLQGPRNAPGVDLGPIRHALQRSAPPFRPSRRLSSTGAAPRASRTSGRLDLAPAPDQNRRLMPPPQTVYLVDGSGQFHRAFHAIRGLATSKGLPTNATYGFTTMLRKLLEDERPEHMAVLFDPPGKTLPPRRSTRSTRPTARRWTTTSRCRSPTSGGCARRCACRSIEVPGYEADDMIATLARQAVEQGLRVVVVSADKDLLQLVERRRGGAQPRPRGQRLHALRPQGGRGEVGRARPSASPTCSRWWATPWTTCPACPASARRARATSSASSARSRASSSTRTT